MFPKSVSGTMRILALAAVMPIPAWGWAEEPVKIGGPGCLMWVERTGEVKLTGQDCRLPIDRTFRIVNTDYSTLLTCNEESTQCWTPCELRMREAMKLGDAYFRRGQITSAARADESKRDFLEAVPFWDQTMKDCVEAK